MIYGSLSTCAIRVELHGVFFLEAATLDDKTQCLCLATVHCVWEQDQQVNKKEGAAASYDAVSCSIIVTCSFFFYLCGSSYNWPI